MENNFKVGDFVYKNDLETFLGIIEFNNAYDDVLAIKPITNHLYIEVDGIVYLYRDTKLKIANFSEKEKLQLKIKYL
jgi:hypothetical protein